MSQESQDPKTQAEKIVNRIAENLQANQGKYDTVKSKTFQIVFSNADPYLFKIAKGKLLQVEKISQKQNADVTMTGDVEVVRKILDKELKPMTAVVTRKVKFDGPIMQLRQLSSSMGLE